MVVRIFIYVTPIYNFGWTKNIFSQTKIITFDSLGAPNTATSRGVTCVVD